MDKNDLVRMLERMEQLRNEQMELSVKNTNIDRKVENERRAFTEVEYEVYNKNQEEIERCEKEYQELERKVRQAFQTDIKLRDCMKITLQQKKFQTREGMVKILEQIEKKEQTRLNQGKASREEEEDYTR